MRPPVTPATRLFLTVASALLAAAMTVGVAAMAWPAGVALGGSLPLILLSAAALIRWRKP
jgi:hypothetical protein